MVTISIFTRQIPIFNFKIIIKTNFHKMSRKLQLFFITKLSFLATSSSSFPLLRNNLARRTRKRQSARENHPTRERVIVWSRVLDCLWLKGRKIRSQFFRGRDIFLLPQKVVDLHSYKKNV